MDLSDSNRRFIGVILSLISLILAFTLFVLIGINAGQELNYDYNIGKVRIVCNVSILLFLFYFSGVIVRYMIFRKSFVFCNCFFFSLLFITHSIYFVLMNYKTENYVPQTTLSIFPYIVTMLFLLLIFVLFIKLIYRVIRDSINNCWYTFCIEDDEESDKNPLNNNDVNIVIDSNYYPGRDCSVCMERLVKDIYRMKCGHIFHEKCVKMYWDYKKNELCPICNQ